MMSRHPVRLWTTVACLTAVLAPFLTALAILEGVRAEAAISVAEGPDLFITGYEYGRNSSLPEGLVARACRNTHVTEARGRIVGRSYVNEKLVTVVGLGESPGRPAPSPGEAWLGWGAARSLGLKPGDELRLQDLDIGVFRVARVLERDAGVATSRLVMMSLADAQTLYATPGQLSDLQVWLRPGPDLANRLLQVAVDLRAAGVPLRIQTRKLVEDYVDRGYSLKGGAFLALYLVALGVAIPALLVTSGFGLSARRQEIGLLKALGFSVVDILEMSLHETAAIAIASTAASFLASWFWLRCLDGWLVASLFVSGLEQGAAAAIPAQFGPVPLVAALGFALVLLATGTMPTAYRAAVARPVEAVQ